MRSMLEKKNIDRVFQENLRDMEIYPNKKVWNHISRELEREQTPSRPASWKRISAAAAVAAVIGMSVFFFNDASDALPVSPAEISDSSADEISSPATNKILTEQERAANPEPVQVAQGVVTEQKKRKALQPLIGNSSGSQVIVTEQDIAKVYTNIDNKYIVDEDKLKQDLLSQESITDRMASLPEVKTVQDQDKKWSVGPTVAPVFYNSLQDGSPINQNLAGNSRSAENTLSVGVKVNYQINEKFFIQSGLNKVELAYNTKNVSAIATGSKLGGNLQNATNSAYYLAPARGVTRATGPDNRSKNGIIGDLNQSMEYYELPIEMKYSLYDKKLGLNLVGGFSTLYLSGNSVALVSGQYATDLGGANNLNNFNFSGNVGIDLDYEISSSWYLNVAPMFKYQFNTFSGNAGNFQPYYFGLYSGLNFKF